MGKTSRPRSKKRRREGSKTKRKKKYQEKSRAKRRRRSELAPVAAPLEVRYAFLIACSTFLVFSVRGTSGGEGIISPAEMRYSLARLVLKGFYILVFLCGCERSFSCELCGCEHSSSRDVLTFLYH